MTCVLRGRWLLVAIVTGLLGFSLAGAGDASLTPLVARARFLMGTRLEIDLPPEQPEAAFEEVFEEVNRLEGVLSNWRQESEVSRLNRAVTGAPFRCSPELYAALQSALHFARTTGGAFDPTVEPLVRQFGLRPPEGRLPDDRPAAGPAPWRMTPAETEMAPVGWRHVRLNPSDRTVVFEARGVGIDFGGIGKGIGLDAAARALARRRIRTALLDFGGQVLAIGAPPGGSSWPVSVAGPGDRRRGVVTIGLRDASASTSGNDERAVAGVAGRVGHILDPSRRSPASFDGTVTVVDRTATSADALSTALYVMGPARGGDWADAKGLAVLFLWRDPDGALRRRASTAFLAIETDADTAVHLTAGSDHP